MAEHRPVIERPVIERPESPPARPSDVPLRPVVLDVPHAVGPSVGDLPVFEPFVYSMGRTLSPDELDFITEFHVTYMQGAVITPALLLRAKRDAALVLPLMEKQAAIALQTPEGEKSAEYRQVEHNLAWVKKLLAV